MGTLRLFLRDHRRFAALLVALALAMKALVPAGYMVGGGARVITISICADSMENRYEKRIVVPQNDKSTGEHAKDGQACPFSALAMASLAGADPDLLALALTFILALGFATAPPLRLGAALRLRPPSQGPPATV